MKGELTTEELLDLLQEEAVEVIVAAYKCKRFGIHEYHPGYGGNSIRLAEEIGDFMGIVAKLSEMNLINPAIANYNAERKIEKVLSFRKEKQCL